MIGRTAAGSIGTGVRTSPTINKKVTEKHL